MNADIKALIATAIAGQGTMVDVGGALPTILTALVEENEALKEQILAVRNPIVLPTPSDGFSNLSRADAIRALNITEQQFNLLLTTVGVPVKLSGLYGGDVLAITLEDTENSGNLTDVAFYCSQEGRIVECALLTESVDGGGNVHYSYYEV